MFVFYRDGMEPAATIRQSDTTIDTTRFVGGADWLRCGQPYPLRLFEQVIGPHVPVSVGDDCRAGLVANQHGDFRVTQTAFPRSRHEVGTQAVRCHMPNLQLFTVSSKSAADGGIIGRFL